MRVEGIEPSTFSLSVKCSTTELHAHEKDAIYLSLFAYLRQFELEAGVVVTAGAAGAVVLVLLIFCISLS